MVADTLFWPPSAVTAVIASPGGKTELGMVASVGNHAPVGGVQYAAMAAAQPGCEAVAEAVAKAVAARSLQVWKIWVEGVKLLCDVSSGVAHPIVAF